MQGTDANHLKTAEWQWIDMQAEGLAEWGGPASPTDELARAMGFRDAEDLWQGKGRDLATPST